MKGIWITWESQRRNIGISTALGYPLHKIEIRSNRFLRYAKSIYHTIKTIHRESPDVVVAQNPSIVLALFVVLYRKVGNYYPVIDAHNSGIYPMDGKSKFLLLIARWVQKKATLTIVTNEKLSKHVEKNGGRAYILQDAIPAIQQAEETQVKDTRSIVCICTYSEDEPYMNIINAARYIPKDIHIHITGNHKGKLKSLDLPENVHLTGFLAEKDYVNLLNTSKFVMDLTTRENCLVCGAYEAVALEKPLILSKTKALSDYFYKGCIYTTPSSQNIANSIIDAFNNIEVLQKEIIELKLDLRTKWQERLSLLQKKLSLLESSTA